MVELKVLGGLGLKGVPFSQPKPLLLLSYLALEGSQLRKHLSELFWQNGNRMKKLTVVLTRLRQGAGKVIEADTKKAWAIVESDVKELLKALDKSDWEKTSELYTGAFLEGIVLEDWSGELEEWIYTTREYLAERVQHALLNLSEEAANKQDFDQAAKLAERAYTLPGLAGTDLTNLKRLYFLLAAGRSILAPKVRKEIEEYGEALQLSTQEARERFKHTKGITLPLRGTSFVGRDEELAELATLLNKAKVALITLLGPAGVGKTRLALQLAQEQQNLGGFKEGVYFVPLDALMDVGLFPANLVSHLGLTQQTKTDPLTQAAEFIAKKNILLILDNFEHLLDGSSLLSKLLAKCPNLKILVTSREKLQLEEEYLFTLEGLPYPKTLTKDAKLSEAVQLFNERARQVRSQFDLEQNLPGVLRICKLVEGLPLGIELSASWVRLMSCEEIAIEIAGGLELLSSTYKNVPERHRSLKAAYEQSWKGLTTKEQEVLRKLSVFIGGFRREAASEVAGATIPVLASLVDKSLLRVLPNGRYDQHLLLYHYGREKLLEASTESTETATRHTIYYARLLKEQAGFFKGPEEKDAINVLAGDIQNLELVWEQLINNNDVHTLQAIIQPFSELCASLGRYREILIIVESAIIKLESLPPEHRFTLGNLYLVKARFLYFLAQFEGAILAGEEGLRLIEVSGRQDLNVIARGLNEVARNFISLGDHSKAVSYFEQAIEILRKNGDAHRMANVQGNLLLTLSLIGEYDKAEAIAYEVKPVYESLGDWEGSVWILSALAGIQRQTQNYQRQKVLLEQALEMYHQKQLTSSWLHCDLLSSLGTAYGYLKHYSLAREYHQQALDVAQATHNLFKLPSILVGLGCSITGLGHFSEARNYFIECLTLLSISKEQVVLFYALIGWSRNEMGLDNVHEAAKVLGFVQAQPNLDQEDQQELEEAMAELRGRLSIAVLEGYLEQGKPMSLEQVFELVLETSDSSPLRMTSFPAN